MNKKVVRDKMRTFLLGLEQDLEHRAAAVDAQRTPGGLTPAGVYWNGFHSGMQVAVGLVRSVLEEIEEVLGVKTT